MKFRIGIDARMIRHSGIGTYLRGLLDGFAELHIPQKEIYPVSFNARIYSIAEQFQYHGQVKNCALWHAPHYNVPLVTGKTKLVVTIHDLIHWIFRKDFFTPLQAAYAGLMLGHAVHRSNAIIAVSNTTKNDLVRYFKADPKKITVTVADLQPAAMADEVERAYLTAVETRSPVFGTHANRGFGTESQTWSRLILPLSEDGVAVDRLFVAVWEPGTGFGPRSRAHQALLTSKWALAEAFEAPASPVQIHSTLAAD